jgi:hypothetical protein
MLLVLGAALSLLAVAIALHALIGAPPALVHYYTSWSVYWLLVLVFGGATIAALIGLITSVGRGSDHGKPALWIETHWGGLGGGLGGWRVSQALAYLLLAAIMGGLLVAAAVGLRPAVPAEQKKAETQPQEVQQPEPKEAVGGEKKEEPPATAPKSPGGKKVSAPTKESAGKK